MAGIGKNVNLGFFNEEETEIINTLSRYFEITSSRNITIANSRYTAILLKPNEDYRLSNFI